MTAPFPADLRLILAHKQKTSARVRFLRFPHGLAAFSPLPALASCRENARGPAEEEAAAPQVVFHPAAVLRGAEARLGLEAGGLAHEAEFTACVDTPAGAIAVRLATFTSTDPPFAAAEAVGGRFVAITEARDCAPVELELLRLAYTALMG